MSAIEREPELSMSQQETEASCIDWINSINSTEVTCMMDLHDGLALAEFIGILSGKRVKVNKLVDRSDTIKQDNLVMASFCKMKLVCATRLPSCTSVSCTLPRSSSPAVIGVAIKLPKRKPRVK